MLIIFDWDETLTSHDTLSLIPEKSLEPYVKPYLDDLAHHTSSHPLGQESSRVTLAHQLEWLDSLADVEIKSIARVQDDGLLVGWHHSNLEERLNKVKLRPGVTTDLTQWLDKRRVATAVLSVSWSSAFIRAALQREGVPIVDVHANDVDVDEQTGKGTGKVMRSIRTGLDKLREMATMVVDNNDPNDGREAGGALLVYAGDSNTDLPCLLAASVGIVVAPGETSSLLDTIHRLGFDVLDGCDGLEAKLRSSVPSAVRRSDVDRAALLSKAPSSVWLVKVPDWVEGTRVLSALERVELDRRTESQPAAAGVAIA